MIFPHIQKHQHPKKRTLQAGFSLMEIMVGLVIGLIATLVIMQVFTAFESRKRATTGTADAQTNGAIALYSISREVQNAGYGLAMFAGSQSPVNCPVSLTVDHDGLPATAGISISPISITNGTSDTVTVRYGDAEAAGIPMTINQVSGASIGVPNNIGCRVGDVVIAAKGGTVSEYSASSSTVVPALPATCSAGRVATVPDLIHVNLTAAPSADVTANDTRLSCIGQWNQYAFSVNNNELVRSVSGVQTPVVTDVVNIQAQYGVSATLVSNVITSWVDPTGTWANPNLDDRKRIKAVRVAVVARNGTIDKETVTTDCSDLASDAQTGLCAWAGTAASPAPAIDLTGIADWDKYRYRVYETIIPLRNMVWNIKSL